MVADALEDRVGEQAKDLAAAPVARLNPNSSTASAAVVSSTPETERDDEEATKYASGSPPTTTSTIVTTRPPRAKTGLRNSNKTKYGIATTPIAP